MEEDREGTKDVTRGKRKHKGARIKKERREEGMEEGEMRE